MYILAHKYTDMMYVCIMSFLFFLSLEKMAKAAKELEEGKNAPEKVQVDLG